MTEPASVVVVGAGSTGCFAAWRFADAGRTVVLVEAGPDVRGREPPALRDGWDFSREHTWGYSSEPNVQGTTTNLLRTKLVGGCGWLTRFAVRNHPADFDHWRPLIGEDWSHAVVREAFNAVERDLDFGTETWHGAQGPIPITRYLDTAATEIDSVVQVALRECGFEQADDLNHPGAMGFGRMPMNSIDGRRVISADLLGDRPGIDLRAQSTAVDLAVDEGRVHGVRMSDGSTIPASTVVLAAGVYGSPSLLMRSGVGRADVLGKLDIDVLVDLPGVGQNLSDHPAVSLDLGYHGVQRPGPVLHTMATFPSSSAEASRGPDLALWISDPEGDPAEAWLDVVLLRPQARGRLSISSTDAAEPPRIWLPEPTDDDLRRLSHGVRRGLEVINRPTVRALCDHPREIPPNDATGLTQWIRANTYSLPHTVGTCAMGISPKDGAVVDPAGRVHGVEGLYVVDASILPGPPTGFPHLVALMMADRIVDGMLARDLRGSA